MGQALYRKYRSKTLSEIVGQEHVAGTLSNALKSGRISHAYLLTGPRGVGKTSIARILAHEINGLPYDDATHLDIIEIDAASNRRIDEIRDLRDRVNTAPSAAKYKVYIIDEVHMLTREAFNALLKTLEEPPAHVVFILATTEAHKLPETIVSRTQRYSFRPVPAPKVIGHLRFIADQEQIVIDDEALALIAEHGDGSFRDSISLLDQASNVTEHVTKSDVEQILGLAPAEQINQLLIALGQQAPAIVAALSGLYAAGYEPAMIGGQLGAAVRSRILNGDSQEPGRDLRLLERLLGVPAARSPKQLLEIVLLQATVSTPVSPANAPVETAAAHPQASAKSTAAASQSTLPKKATVAPEPAPQAEPPASPQPLPEKQPAVAGDTPAETMDTADVNAIWQTALNEIKKQYNTLYGIARMAKPELAGDTLTLTLKFAFHQKRLNEAKNRKVFADVISRLSGRPIEIVCVVGETGKVEAIAPAPTDVSAISNIFGGAEVIES